MIKCQICGNEFSLITNSHLKKHDFNPKEYKKLFGEMSLTPIEVRERVSTMYKGEGNPNFGNHMVPWNKGKSGLQSDPKKGLTLEEFYGRVRSKIIRQKISNSHTGKKYTPSRSHLKQLREQCKKMNDMDRSLVGRSISLSLKGKFKGELNPNWRGGSSDYGNDFTFELKEKIRNLYDRRCYLCGTSEGENRLCIHHVDNDKHNNSVENLVPLCKSCHSSCHFIDVVILIPWWENV